MQWFDVKKFLAPANWSLLEFPKPLGGLGLGNLQHKKRELIFKWLWRFLREPNSLWRSIVAEKYKYGESFAPADLQITINGGPWKSICSLILNHPQSKNMAIHSIRKKVGNGEDTMFWHDSWVGEKPLKLICPRLFIISNTQSSTISSMGFWAMGYFGNGSWCGSDLLDRKRSTRVII